MAAALFAGQLPDTDDPVEVSSAGLLDGGLPVPGEVVDVMDGYGIDLRAHRSRTLTPDLLERADLVIGMGRRHVNEAVVLDPPCWQQAFRFRELVRRGEELGPRAPSQGVRSWIAAVHGDRDRAALAHRIAADEIADPYGGPLAGYRATAAELASLTGRLAALLWPGEQRDAVAQ
jgi:low molecular weight protein-tyrosine phosphatase